MTDFVSVTEFAKRRGMHPRTARRFVLALQENLSREYGASAPRVYVRNGPLGHIQIDTQAVNIGQEKITVQDLILQLCSIEKRVSRLERRLG